jgi:hypothetical protein
VILRRREQAELGEHVPTWVSTVLGDMNSWPAFGDATLTLDGFFGWPLRLSA